MGQVPAFLLGTVNGRVASVAKFGRKKIPFDGTTLGLTQACVQAGIKVGQVGHAWYGESRPHPRDPGRRVVMSDSGGGDRTPDGVWVTETRCDTCNYITNSAGKCANPNKHK